MLTTFTRLFASDWGYGNRPPVRRTVITAKLARTWLTRFRQIVRYTSGTRKELHRETRSFSSSLTARFLFTLV
ncbi:hypothetical protein P7C70_g4598, partial [Phenoliferia sp. Uapishka_3]